jgi:cell division protein FtsI/penicillin-binding protein 2
VFRERKQPLAPTREFARALLGSVGPVTGDMVEQGGGRYVAGDIAGTSGLQRRYDEQLAGTAGVTVHAVGADGAARELFTVAPKPGTDLRLTLDAAVQRAADTALRGLDQAGALVAVDVRTGRVLAVGNTPATGLNRALVGQYPPGSTFKVVTTLSLLQKGLKPSDTVACPPTASVDGRSFRNYEAEEFGEVPFRTDFARSCNTAFVALSSRLGATDLRDSAASVGLGRDWDLGTDAFAGSIPATTSDVDRAAAAFGQGRNLVSPLAVTVATASVARGSYLPPTLVLRPGADPAEAEPLPKGPVTTLQSLMRDVVTSGTGTALRDVPGGPVRAKTGTAEFGSESPPKTRAWITGWQGTVAFTAFVEEGKSGGTVAGPVAARFLRTLAR